jgi:hypothetical protein
MHMAKIVDNEKAFECTFIWVFTLLNVIKKFTVLSKFDLIMMTRAVARLLRRFSEKIFTSIHKAARQNAIIDYGR